MGGCVVHFLWTLICSLFFPPTSGFSSGLEPQPKPKIHNYVVNVHCSTPYVTSGWSLHAWVHIFGDCIVAGQCMCLHTFKLNMDVTKFFIFRKHKLGNRIPIWKVWCGKGAPLICPLQDLVCCDWIPPVSPVSMTWYLIDEI